MLHGGSLSKIRNFESACERAANIVQANLDAVETIRTVALTSTVHDDFYNYALPSDFKKPIDLYPQDSRTSLDQASRPYVGRFDLRKNIESKTISIEGSEGSKILRVNWRTRQGKTLNTLNSLTSNGTWSASGSATGVVLDEITKYSGSASIRFNLVASGDGIQNTTMSALDLTNEDEVADVFTAFYIKNSADLALLTSATQIWGNDLTTAYWTGVAQTAQADGTAFRVGWNVIKTPWSTATETGTVAPATIDSYRITFAATPAITNIRVDNIIFSIGRNFDIKYYSRFLFKNSSGTFIAKPTTDSDTVVGEGDLNNIFLYELLKISAHQIEGEDSVSDINFANQNLHGNPNSPDPSMRVGLYAKYRSENPSFSIKPVTRYSSGPRFRN